MTAVRTSIGRPWRVVERNAHVARQSWFTHVAALAEPFLFLFSIGVGVGALVSGVEGPGGTEVPYRTFVAPALLASAAMNSAVFSTAIDFFAKFKWIQTYDAMLATPITTADVLHGELLWVVLRIGVNSSAFIVTMAALGLLESAWALLLLPAAILVAFAFGSAGFLAATYLRTWLDFDLVQLALIPLFLFSASFFPLTQYPDGLAWVVRLTPLYHGVDLCRDLALGTIDWTALVSIAYLAAMGAIAMHLAERRVASLLQP